MKDFIVGIFGKYFGTIIMSLVPLIELKGGIVFARGVGFSFLEAFGLAYIGSTIVFIPIFFLLKPILNLLKKIKFIAKFAQRIENFFTEKAQKTIGNSEKEDKKRGMSERALKMLGVFIFVAIPLPMTGVWTGTAVAVFLNLKFKEAVLPIVLGNFVAGLIISILADLCLGILDYILWGLFALAFILFIVTIIKMALSKSKSEK